MNSIEIIPVTKRCQLKKFVKLTNQINASNPNYIPAFFMEKWQVVHPKKNPFYQHARVKKFLALQNGKVVGRISAHIDDLNEKFKEQKLGCFGFFESIDSVEVAQKLFQHAGDFLKSEGCTSMIGPFNFNMNEEMGLLIEGFEHPQMIAMPYNPAYYISLLEQNSFSKMKDLLCWYYDNKEIPEAPQQIADYVMQQPGLTIRNLDKKNILRDLKIIMEVFNDAWSNNWSFVPMTEAEIAKAAKDFDLIADPKFVLIAEVFGKPAAICVGLPNIYEIIGDLKGRLLPFNWIKFLYRLKSHTFKTGRLALLGVKKEYRGSVLGGLSVLLYVKFNQMGLEQDYKYGELSWTLEDNDKINQGIQFMGGKVYKKYRIYQKSL